MVFSNKISLPLGIDLEFAKRTVSKVSTIKIHKKSNTTSLIFTCNGVQADRGFADIWHY